jgi:tetratricopeptide (TPR) repeat protein
VRDGGPYNYRISPEETYAEPTNREGKLEAMWFTSIPSGYLAWKERRRALRELANLQQQEHSKLILDESNLVNRAKVSLSVGDLAAAQRFWDEALAWYPRFAKGSDDSLEILLGLQRFDEAEALMLEGQQREPRDSFYAEGYAMVAERHGDTEEAFRRWSAVLKRFPRSSMAYVHGVICLRRVGRLDEAEALNRRALKLFPKDVRLWVNAANIAEQQPDWPEAMRRWEVVCDEFRHFTGDIGIARALGELGRVEEAEQRLKEVQTRRPLEVEIPIALARLAKQRGDNDEAVRRWADIRRHFPMLPVGYQGGFRELLEMGRHADAELILLSAIDRFPAEAWPAVEYASLAHIQQEWAAAAARWATVRAGWPDRQDGYLREAEALAALGRKDEAAQLRAELQHRSAR